MQAPVGPNCSHMTRSENQVYVGGAAGHGRPWLPVFFWRFPGAAERGALPTGGHRMRLHRNAALSWHGRRCLAERVVEEGWTLRAAAELVLG